VHTCRRPTAYSAQKIVSSRPVQKWIALLMKQAKGKTNCSHPRRGLVLKKTSQSMPKNKAKKNSYLSLLASVKEEMAEPRIAESAKMTAKRRFANKVKKVAKP
jgi:hypothetical protein